MFLNICEVEGCVAVHCRAGLGRTGTLAALWLMRSAGFPARAAVGWLRVVRPGSVVGPQQPFLTACEARGWDGNALLLPPPPPPAGDSDSRQRARPGSDQWGGSHGKAAAPPSYLLLSGGAQPSAWEEEGCPRLADACDARGAHSRASRPRRAALVRASPRIDCA